MANRPVLPPHSVITNGDMSGNLTSLVSLIPTLSLVAYTFKWTGTSPVGTIKIQGSDDYSLDATGAVNNSGTWTDLYLTYNGAVAASVALTGNTGNGLVDLGPTGIYALRAVYTRTSGIGTLNCLISAKVT